jgi:hypothetical protein
MSFSNLFGGNVSSFNIDIETNSIASSMEIDDNISQSVPTYIEFNNNDYISKSVPNNMYYNDDDNYEGKHKVSFKINLASENRKPTRKDNILKNNENKPRDQIMFNDDLFRRIIFGDDTPNMTKDENKNKKILCNSPICNHKDFSEDSTPVISPQINVSTIDDLIIIGKTYHCKKNKDYNGVSLRILCDLVGPLSELRDMVGMKTVKENIINQIIFFLQGFNKKNACGKCNECAFQLPCLRGQDDMLHTVITGSPGCGKTELGKIMGKVYKALGILENGNFKIVSRSDLVGKYLGHTAAKTQSVIDSCKGGVMFIDEAYSLGSGNDNNKDSFSKECLDTLNQNLSERRDFLCIIAGYKEELEKCFFSMNPGLKRRFTFRYDIDKYTPEELLEIFLLKLKKEGWDVESHYLDNDTFELRQLKEKQEKELVLLFKQNYTQMPHFGGDVETLFLNCKIIHGKRVLFLDQNLRKILTINDVKKGFDQYISHRKYKDSLNDYDDTSFYS